MRYKNNLGSDIKEEKIMCALVNELMMPILVLDRTDIQQNFKFDTPKIWLEKTSLCQNSAAQRNFESDH